VFYATKVQAAEAVLLQRGTTNVSSLASAVTNLSLSVEILKRLARRTEDSYHFANSMQTSHRKIPYIGAVKGVGTNYLWSQVLPLYEKELDDFSAAVAAGQPVLPEPTKPAAINKANPEIAEPQ
jgi:hypothetical protein